MSQASLLLRCFVCCAVGAAALPLTGAARAEPPAAPQTDALPPETAEIEHEEPLDFSVLAGAPTFDASRFDAAKFRPGRYATGWDAKVGVDHHAPAVPLPNAAPDQSGGVAWAHVTAPGLPSALSWDQAAIETRIDPQEQGRLGMMLSRSLPVGGNVSVTLQNGYAVTQALPSTATAAAHGDAGAPHTFDANHAVRFRILPADTTFSFGATHSSTDERWLRSLSAEQKLLGGPVSITGAMSETTNGETSKSLKAGFKRTW